MDNLDASLLVLIASVIILTSCSPIHYSWHERLVDELPNGTYCYQNNSIWWFYIHASREDTDHYIVNGIPTLPFNGEWVQGDDPGMFDDQGPFEIAESTEGKPLTQPKIESGVLDHAVVISSK